MIGIMLPLRYQFNRAAIGWNGESFDETVKSVSTICQGIGVIIHFNKGVVRSVVFVMLLNSYLCNGSIGSYGECFDVAIIATTGIGHGIFIWGDLDKRVPRTLTIIVLQ